MLNLNQRKSILIESSTFFKTILEPNHINLILKAEAENPWFSPDQIKHAAEAWANALSDEEINEWISREQLKDNSSIKNVGLILAGNIPLVGLHDVISVFLSGHKSKIKFSSKDKVLMSAYIDHLKNNFPETNEYFEEVEQLKNMDAVIATGSNNTGRYFEYYFKNIPHIIRKNKNSAAIIFGNESRKELERLGEDIFRYYGLGCRNVSAVFIPQGYDLTKLLDALEIYSDIQHHNKYINNYQYHKAILLLNLDAHLDNNFLIVRKDEKIYSPVGMLNYIEYQDLDHLNELIKSQENDIQCLVSSEKKYPNSFDFGEAQKPKLWDYADGENTIEFLKSL